MIRINLLPVRTDKKKESARKQLIVLAGSVLITIVLFLVIMALIGLKISSTKNDISAAEKRIAELKIKIGKINNLEKLKTDVQNKLDILNRLRKEKTGPVQRLMILSQSAPDKLWITKYIESGASATINGIAFSEDLIANFMKALDVSSEFSNVELGFSEQIEMGGVKVKKFELKLNLKNVAPPVPVSSKPVKEQQSPGTKMSGTGSVAPATQNK